MKDRLKKVGPRPFGGVGAKLKRLWFGFLLFCGGKFVGDFLFDFLELLIIFLICLGDLGNFYLFGVLPFWWVGVCLGISF